MKPFIFLTILILIPSVFAEDDDNDFSFCDDLFEELSDAIFYIPEKFFDYILYLMNQALEPFNNLIREFMEENPDISNNYYNWKIITYILSFFYVLIIAYAGFLFIISGHDVVKRELAKEWLKNTLLMLILIQGSYFIYELILELNSTLVQSILSRIPESFYQLQNLGLFNQGTQTTLLLIYMIILLITAVFLAIRIIIIFLGLILFPLGIFLYFIPPLRSYGKLFLNILMVFIFSTFFASLILLVVSQLVVQYGGITKTMFMICAYLLVIFLFIFLGKFTLSISSHKSTSSKSIIKYYKTITKVVRSKEGK